MGILNKKIGIFGIIVTIAILIGLYFCTEYLFIHYIDFSAKKLVELEQNGLLSRKYGYVWQEINANNDMNLAEQTITSGLNGFDTRDDTRQSKVKNFPSLAAVAELNKIKSLNRTIRVNDRNGIVLADIQTIHTSINLTDLNEILLKSLIATEDKHYYTRSHGYDFNAIMRATAKAALRSLVTFKLQYPRGSSTIQMQVARFLLMKYDRRGFAYTEKSVLRKLNELKLSQALGLMYSKDDILYLYVNHCVAAGRGMLGYHDISMGLFGVTPDKLSVPQSLYLSRIVKWNRQVPQKIINQIKANMPALREQFRWDRNDEKEISNALDTLTFRDPRPIIASNSYVLDLANEYWKMICRHNGMSSSEVAQMDIADPESSIRRYGNCSITLTLDYRLQKLLDNIVNKRGFGSDTLLRTDVRLGGEGYTFFSETVPSDSMRQVSVIENDTTFTFDDGVTSSLLGGDTLVCNIRYKKLENDSIRRSCFYYKRDTLRVSGQYYAYAIMDSKTGKLLAYSSCDKLGSRLQSLNVNKTPNGSSVAKPLIYALNYDLGVYQPSDMLSDDEEYRDTSLWARTRIVKNGVAVGMNYKNVPDRGGYEVHNHNDTFEGYDFVYNHLSNSNNIVAVETMYRFTNALKGKTNKVRQLLDRTAISNLQGKNELTGPEFYSALVSVLSNSNDRFSSNYSAVLGTVELTLLEQMHLFNVLYNNRIIEAPFQHPSLFINDVSLGESSVAFTDNIKTYTLFNDLKSIRPVHLALHKRLVSNGTDLMVQYDQCSDSSLLLSNFAKSGTTDDIIKPFNADITDSAKTNYGLWNAVLHIRLTKNDLENAMMDDSLLKQRNYPAVTDSVADEELDITLACIGESNRQFTGNRDGKSLHGYVSREILHKFGVPCTSGFYARYEDSLTKNVSARKKYMTNDKSDLSFLSKTMVSLKSAFGAKAAIDDLRFDNDLRLKGKSYRTMLRFAKYTGDQSREYNAMLDTLKKGVSRDESIRIVQKISIIETDNQVLKRDMERACAILIKSLEQIK
jgi:membrane peptidoglycan carboxypeptidase